MAIKGVAQDGHRPGREVALPSSRSYGLFRYRFTIDDDLWQLIKPLLPSPPRRHRYPGQRLDERKVLGGILYVLVTGIAWEDLPQQLGYGSGMTCWRRLRDWNQAGVFDQLHRLLLAKLHQAGQLDWSRAVIDAAHVRALKGGRRPAQARSTVADRAASIT